MADRDELKAILIELWQDGYRSPQTYNDTDVMPTHEYEQTLAEHVDYALNKIEALRAPIQPVATQEDAGNVQAEEAKRMQWVLRQIVSALPSNKDWLDPALEREAKHWGNATLESSGNVQAVQMSGDVLPNMTKDDALRLAVKTLRALQCGDDSMWPLIGNIIEEVEQAITTFLPASQPSNVVQDAQDGDTAAKYLREHTIPALKKCAQDLGIALPAATVPPVGVPITSMDEWKAKYLPEHHRESLTLAQAMEFLTLGLQSAKQIATASNAGEAMLGEKS